MDTTSRLPRQIHPVPRSDRPGGGTPGARSAGRTERVAAARTTPGDVEAAQRWLAARLAADAARFAPASPAAFRAGRSAVARNRVLTAAAFAIATTAMALAAAATADGPDARAPVAAVERAAAGCAVAAGR